MEALFSCKRVKRVFNFHIIISSLSLILEVFKLENKTSELLLVILVTCRVTINKTRIKAQMTKTLTFLGQLY